MTREIDKGKRRIEVKAHNDVIVLRQLTVEDAQTYFDLIDHDREHYSQFDDVTAKKYQVVGDVEDSIINQKPNKYRFGIWDGDVMVGSNNLTVLEDGSAEIGYWVGSQYTGQGYASRALSPLVGFAFNDLGLHEVFTNIVVGNEASRKTVENAGFEFRGIDEGCWVHFMLKDRYDN
ncbi:MAG: GNAT family protein [Candidatus Saccharimonadales bacterium]